MASKDIEIDVDDFARALWGILDDVQVGIESAFEPSLRAACKRARDVTKRHSPVRSAGKPYKNGWSFSIDRSGHEAVGEVGNKNQPGLAHLLEKGHATEGGGYVPGRPHISKGADEGEKVFIKQILKRTDKAL